MEINIDSNTLEGYPKNAVCRAVVVPDKLRQRFIDRLDTATLSNSDKRNIAIEQEIKEMENIINNLKNKLHN